MTSPSFSAQQARHTRPQTDAAPYGSARYTAEDCASMPNERQQAIERVIHAMSASLDEPLSLETMAEIAAFSPYHFNRLFRALTGVPPFKFQAALRMSIAKRLLLTTQLSVTDICFTVGYSSLGTFTTHFTRYVGLGPRDLRRLAERRDPPPALVCCGAACPPDRREPADISLTGYVHGPTTRPAFIFVGLFTSAMPQDCPAGCAVLAAPGAFRLPPVPDGAYFVYAAAVAHSDDPLAYLLPDERTLCVGVGPDQIVVRNGRITHPLDITVRRVRLTDPPLLMALPYLIQGQANTRRAAASPPAPVS